MLPDLYTNVAGTKGGIENLSSGAFESLKITCFVCIMSWALVITHITANIQVACPFKSV